MRVFITGVAGSGKSMVVSELRRQGYYAIDLDTTDLCAWIDRNTGKNVSYRKDAGNTWFERHSWRCDIVRLEALLNSISADTDVYVAGKVAKSQIVNIRGLFDRIIVLSPSDAVLRERLRTRTTNPEYFAQSEKQQDHILQARNEFETACRVVGAVSVSTEQDVGKTVEQVLTARV